MFLRCYRPSRIDCRDNELPPIRSALVQGIAGILFSLVHMRYSRIVGGLLGVLGVGPGQISRLANTRSNVRPTS
jgi:hypothetical protein